MSEKVLAVCVSATKSYLYAWKQCINNISAAVAHYPSGHFIYASDDSKECKEAAEFLKFSLPENWNIHHIVHKIKDDTSENYKQEAQQRIAVLQGSTFAKARQIKANICWSVESDILVPPNSLKVLEWTLDNPDNYYELAALTYPNTGFLGGFGTAQHPIAEDFLPSERKLPKKLILLDKINKERLKELSEQKTSVAEKLLKKEVARSKRIHEKIKNCPPQGNIWELNAKFGWRRRGWLDFAYPALGKGSIIPIDWHGLGCLLMNQRALSFANFDGYGPDCGGTQDLFLFWKKWHPNNIRAALNTYCLCDHIKPDKTKEKNYIHYISYFEEEGECKGHLRIFSKPWFGF